MRQGKDLEYAALLNRIRLGQQTDVDVLTLMTRVCGKGHVDSVDIQDSLVLCARHELKDTVNDHFLGLLPSKEHFFYSKDIDENGTVLSDLEVKHINSIRAVLKPVLKV